MLISGLKTVDVGVVCLGNLYYFAIREANLGNLGLILVRFLGIAGNVAYEGGKLQFKLEAP